MFFVIHLSHPHSTEDMPIASTNVYFYQLAMRVSRQSTCLVTTRTDNSLQNANCIFSFIPYLLKAAFNYSGYVVQHKLTELTLYRRSADRFI